MVAVPVVPLKRFIQFAWIPVLISILATPAIGRADDYPQWRGPQRAGISQETGLLKEWPAAGPKLLWQVKDLGFGFSTPAIAGGRIYLLSNKGLDEEYVQALDVKDGKPLWTRRIGKVGNPDQQPNHPGARSTPTVDGKALYVLGSDGDLLCLDAATGAVRWQKSLRADFEGKPGTWAYSESPLIDGDVLVCTPGGAQATIVALNKKTGEPIWKSAVPEGDAAGYASAIVAEIGGVKQYVQFLEKGVVGVDAKTGKFLWRYDKTASTTNIPTPVAYNDAVYTSGRPGGALARVTRKEDGFAVEQVYMAQSLPTSIGGVVRLGDYMYGTGPRGLQCVEFATGTVKWMERGVGPGSVCFADGRLYVHGENGDVALVEAAPDGYKEHGRFTLPDQPARRDTRAWAYPVVANGRLYIRDLESLWCYDVKAAK